MSLLIKNAECIITLDSEGHRYRQADLLIEGPAIKAIGFNLPAGDGDEIINARGKIVLPGLINTHHHLYQTLTRNIPATQDIPLFPWLMTLYEIWRELTPEAVRLGALVGLGELLKTGCTCSTDHHYVFPGGQGKEIIDMEIQAARELGIRFHATRGSMSLGKSQGGLPPDEVVQDEEEILADSERLIRQYHETAPYAMCRVALAPCSPFSVTPELMRDSAVLARRYGVMLHTHLAETVDEEKFCIEKFGRRPVAYMADLGWLGSDVWFAHAIHLNDAEIALLGETRSGVAHCPVSNMKLSSGVCRIKDLLAAGARVGLAVDGSASNDSSNMWNEMRVAYLLQKLVYGNDGLAAEEVLRLATTGGARVLGRKDLGYLAPGMAADLILVNFADLSFAGGQHDPVAAIITCGDSQLVDTTIVNGQVVVREGRLVRINEEEIIRQANRVSREMLDRAGRRTGRDYFAYPTRKRLI